MGFEFRLLLSHGVGIEIGLTPIGLMMNVMLCWLIIWNLKLWKLVKLELRCLMEL